MAGPIGPRGYGTAEYYAEVQRRARALADRFPIHPLHDKRQVAEHISATGQLLGARGTGRTTARIISGIGSAISKLGELVMINDHHQSERELFYSQWLKREVIDNVRKLGLRKIWVGWKYEWHDFDHHRDSPRVLSAGVVIQFGEPEQADKERYCMREVTYGV